MDYTSINKLIYTKELINIINIIINKQFPYYIISHFVLYLFMLMNTNLQFHFYLQLKFLYREFV